MIAILIISHELEYRAKNLYEHIHKPTLRGQLKELQHLEWHVVFRSQNVSFAQQGSTPQVVWKFDVHHSWPLQHCEHVSLASHSLPSSQHIIEDIGCGKYGINFPIKACLIFFLMFLFFTTNTTIFTTSCTEFTFETMDSNFSGTASSTISGIDLLSFPLRKVFSFVDVWLTSWTISGCYSIKSVQR